MDTNQGTALTTEAALRAISGRLKAERERAEAASGMSDRIKGHGERNSKARQLRKDEGNSFQAEIVEQMRKRQAEGRQKAHLKQRGSSSSRAHMDADGGSPVATEKGQLEAWKLSVRARVGVLLHLHLPLPVTSFRGVGVARVLVLHGTCAALDVVDGLSWGVEVGRDGQ
ncbi:MAG: hypothetical protein WDW38_007154 [Sanguina aurantia]